MTEKKTILAIIGSASSNSSNLHLVEQISTLVKDEFQLTIFNDLKSLPHFDPELSINNPPTQIIDLRKKIDQADAIIICTPEYVYSIPSGLKNAIEWCIATTVFTDKPSWLITAAAGSEKGHEELQLIMKTAMAKFTNGTALLIRGVKGKFALDGNLTDNEIKDQLKKFIGSLTELMTS